MEPQLEGCGKRLALRAGRLGARRLQWSRNLRVAESCRALGGRRARPAASMEPQLEGCGKRITAGPQRKDVELQWSRNLRVAERRYRV